MQVGLIGAGNMARALARGWGDAILCFDPATERAQALAAEVGGESLASGSEVAQRADLVVLCHKPPVLDLVATELGDAAEAVVSILGGVPLEDVRKAYPGRPVFRFIPNTPVEVGKGMLGYAQESGADTDPGLEERVLELFGRLGTVVPLPDAQLDVCMALMSNAPAYVALVVEAWVDAGIRHGLPADVASELVVGAVEGSAELIRARGMDTLTVRREVTSPGGSTAKGLDAFERAGLRAAFSDALDAVLAGRTAA